MALLSAVLLLGAAPTWQLVWSDEFDNSGPPDPAKWRYETGYRRNHEAQYYTDDRRENARIEDGHLVLEARKDNFEGHPITSASLTTKDTFSWTYGRLEVRAKVPAGRGTWPAIWTLGTNAHEVGWPKCGEVDVMESVGFDPNHAHFNVHVPTMNSLAGSFHGPSSLVQAVPDGLATDWHVYAMEWFPDRIDLFMDDKKELTYLNDGSHDPATWPFDKPQYLKLNLAIGGDWGGMKGIDDSLFPAQFLVDYVRIYKQQE